MANLTNNNKLIDEINSKLKQVNVMPTANVSNVGKVIQYIGPDDDINNFFNGHFYRCISDGQDPATYSWEEIVLGVTSYDDLTDKLIAGDNITIGDKCTTSGTVTGPCDNGFHIPTKAEWDSVIALNLTSAQVVSALHIPYGGIRRHNDGSFDYVRSEARFWVSNAITGSGDMMNNYYAYISQYATAVVSSNTIALGCNIRAFKNTPVVPDATWTETITGKVREKDGLISILVDTDTYVTMQDKNVGATTVWNTGDTVSSENVGDYFQWGNNHGFKLNSTGDTSSTQVDASSYGPGEYDSNTFVIGQINWMSVDNYDLWGAETGCAVEHNVISAVDTDTLVDLKDTTITNPTDGQIVRYDATSEKWLNVNLPKDIDITDEMPEAVCDGSQGMIIYTGLYHLEDGYKPGCIYVPTMRDSYDFTTDHTLDSDDPSDYSVMENNLGKIGYNTTDDYYFTVQDAGTNDGYTYQVAVLADGSGELIDVWTRYSTLKEYATLYSSTDHTVPLYYIKEKIPSSSAYKCVILSTGEEGSVTQRGLVPIAFGYEESILSDCYYKEIQLVDNRLVALKDVTINNISDGDIIKYNSSTGKFENKSSCVSGKDGIRVYPSGTYKNFSDRRGPCEEGFHIPTRNEVANLGNALSNSNSGAQRTALLVALGMCYWGYVYNDTEDTSSNGVYFWTSDTSSYSASYGYTAHASNYRTTSFGASTFSVGHAFPIRPFADNYIEPDSTWLHTNFGQCDVYQKDNLISIEGGNYKATIADKNIGQTEYPNNLEDVRPETVGYYFQWGNSYGKPSGLGSGYMTTTGSVSGDTVNYNNSTWYKNDTWITRAGNSVRMWGNDSSQPASQCEVISFDKKSIELVNLKDTNITDPSDGDIIKYDATSHKWINGTGGSGTNQSDIAFATITLSGTSVTFTNDFITTNTLVSYTILNGAVPSGIVSASVNNGFATFESTASENLQFYVKFEKSNSNSTILTDNS